MKSYDWLKIRVNLPDDPVVHWLARRLKRSPDDIVGKLVRFWRWADQVTADGRLPGLVLADVDKLLGCKGFAAALRDVPKGAWLAEADGGLVIPRFDEHNSESAKKRAIEREKKRRQRDELSRSCPGDNGTEAGHERDGRGRGRGRERGRVGKDLPAAPAAGSSEPTIRRAPSGPVQELLAWFRDEYERLRGSPYVIAARDGVAAAKALKAFDGTELRARLGRGLQLEDDGFIANSDRGLAFLLGQINRPSLRGLAPVAARGGAPSATAQVQTIAAVTERLIREEQRGQG